MYKGIGQIPPGFTLGIAVQASEAAEYVKAKWREFEQLGGKLGVMQQQAVKVIRAAQAEGDTKTEQEARNLLVEIGRIRLEWGKQRERALAWKAKVPGLGAIIVPLAIAGAVIAAAAAVALLFRRTTASEKTLDALAAGVLTPSQAQALERARRPGLLGGLADTAKWVALAVGGALLIPIIAKRGGGSMTWLALGGVLLIPTIAKRGGMM